MKSINFVQFLFFTLLLTISNGLFAQGIGINDDNSSPAASAALDVKSTAKGILIPRMTTVQRNAIASPATSLLVFDTDVNTFWFYDGSAWAELGNDGDWSISGNNITRTGFVGINATTYANKLHVIETSNVPTAAVWAEGSNGPTYGQLAVQGNTDHEGDSTLDIGGQEIGVLGMSTGGSATDNYGIFGHANGWGGHFQHTTSGNMVNLGGSNNAVEVTGQTLLNGDLGMDVTSLASNVHFQHDRYTGGTVSGNNMGGLTIENGFNNAQWKFYPSQSTSNLTLYFNGLTKGNFDDVSGAYASTSDLRLKKNITNIKATMNRLMQLRPTTYHYKVQKDDDQRRAGFIAQELIKVFPDVVRIQKDDTNGNSELGDIHLVSYTEIIPYMVKGMQEQQTQIEKLQKELEEIKVLLKSMNK